MTTMSVSAYTQRIRLYAVDYAFFYCQIYMNCAVLSLSVDRHIKLPSMCRIVCFINTHISFNRQVKLHLFSCLCLHSKMHSPIQANAHTNCNRLKQKHMFKAFARDKFCRWLFSLRVVFGENSLRPLFYSELFKYRNSVRDFLCRHKSIHKCRKIFIQ